MKRTARRFAASTIRRNSSCNAIGGGNVRELLNVVERAVVLSKSDIISAQDLPETLRANEPTFSVSAGRLGNNLKSSLVAPERQLILEALEANGWNRQGTADMLGINRTTLFKKMKKYQIEFEAQMSF